MNAYCINKKLFLFFFFVSITFASAYAHADDEIIIYVDVDKHRNIDFFEVETYGTSWDTAFKSLHDPLRFGDPNATYTVRIPNEHGNISKKIIINN